MNDEDRKRQLLVELARARAAMSRAGDGLQHAFDFKTRLRTSLQEDTGWWIGGAVAGVGLLLLVARVRRPVVVAPRLRQKTNTEAATEVVAQPAAAGAALGIVLTLGKWIFPLVRPMIMSWLTEKAAAWYGEKKNQP